MQLSQIAKTVQLFGLKKRHAGSWLGRSPFRKMEKYAGTFSRHHGWVFVGPCHPCAHGPPAKNWMLEVLHLFRCFTHTHRCRGALLRPRRMRWRWRWRKDENEMTMKMRWQLINQNTRGGTQKGKGKRENTNTNTPGPERARKKAKADGRRAKKPTRGGGADRRARAKAYLGTRRTQTWPRERKRAWDRGPMGT